MWKKLFGAFCALLVFTCLSAFAESGFRNTVLIEDSLSDDDFARESFEIGTSYYKITRSNYKDSTVDFIKGDLGGGNRSFEKWLATEDGPFMGLFAGCKIESSTPATVAGFEAERVLLNIMDKQGEVLIIHGGERDLYCGYYGEKDDCQRFLPEFNRALDNLSFRDFVSGRQWTGSSQEAPGFKVINVEYGTTIFGGDARRDDILFSSPYVDIGWPAGSVAIDCTALSKEKEVCFYTDLMDGIEASVTIRPYISVGMSYVEMVVDAGYKTWDLADYFQEVDLYDKESVVLRDDLVYQIAAQDVDGDGQCELLAFAGDERTELELIILKFRDSILWPMYRSVGTGVAYCQDGDPTTIFVEGLRDELGENLSLNAEATELTEKALEMGTTELNFGSDDYSSTIDSNDVEAEDATDTVTAAPLSNENTTEDLFTTGLGNISGNLANDGFAVEGDGMSFYADGKALWKIGDDEASAVKLAEGRFDSLNYMDGYIYAVLERKEEITCYGFEWNVRALQGYSNQYDEEDISEYLCSVRVPVRIAADGYGILEILGEERAENCNGISEYRCMAVADGYIYYVGGNQTPFSYQFESYNYFLDECGLCDFESRRGNSVYRMRLDGSEVMEFIPNIGNSTPEFATNGEQIYVLKAYEIFLEVVPETMQSYDMEGNLLWETECRDIDYYDSYINEYNLAATDNGAITAQDYDMMIDKLCLYSADGHQRKLVCNVWCVEPAVACNGYIYTYYSEDDEPYSDDDDIYNPHNIAIFRAPIDNPEARETICRGTFFYTEFGSANYIRMNVLGDWLYIRYLEYSNFYDDYVSAYCRYNMTTGETQSLSDGVARAETFTGFFGYVVE